MKDVSQAAGRFVVSDELWALIEPHLPRRVNTHRFGGGRPRKPDRVCMDAIFFVLRTGSQWNALDATGICPSSTAQDRFQEWERAGVFLKLWKAGLMEYDDLKGLDWSWLSMDGAMTKSPLSGEKCGPNPTDRGKEGGKRSLLTEGQGVLIDLAVDGANRHDMRMVRETIQSIPIERPDPTRRKPQGMCLDKGYDYDDVREVLAEFGFTAHIRSRGEEAHLIALACSQAPEGHSRWTLRLLADQMVALEYVDGLSKDTVSRVLKKTSSSPG